MEDTLLIDDYQDDDQEHDNTRHSRVQKEVVAILEQLDVSGRTVKHTYSLYVGSNSIGRDPSLNTIVIQSDNSSISKQHAVININTPSVNTHIAALSQPLITQLSHTLLDAEEVFFTDVGSANKTLILPHYSSTPFSDKTSYRLQPHKPRLLKHGEFVYLGSVCCKFSWKDYQQAVQRAEKEKQRAGQMDEKEEDVGATQVYDDQETEAGDAPVDRQAEVDAGDTVVYNKDEDDTPSNAIHHTAKHKYLPTDSANDSTATLIYQDEDVEKTQAMEQQKEPAAAADEAEGAPTLELHDEEDREEVDHQAQSIAPSSPVEKPISSASVPANPVPAQPIDHTAVKDISPDLFSFSDFDDVAVASPSLELAAPANSHETADTKPATATAPVDLEHLAAAEASQTRSDAFSSAGHATIKDNESESNLHPVITSASPPAHGKATAASRKPPATSTQPRRTRSSLTPTPPDQQEDQPEEASKGKSDSDLEHKQVSEEKKDDSQQLTSTTSLRPSPSAAVIQQAVDHSLPSSASAMAVPWRTKPRKLAAQEETKQAERKRSGARAKQTQTGKKKVAKPVDEEEEKDMQTEREPPTTEKAETAMNEEAAPDVVMQTEDNPPAVAAKEIADEGKDALESVPDAQQSTSKRGKPTGVDRRKRKQLVTEADEKAQPESHATIPETTEAAGFIPPSSSTTSWKRARRLSDEAEKAAKATLENVEATEEEQQPALSPNTGITRRHSGLSSKLTPVKEHGKSHSRSSSSGNSSKASLSTSPHTHPSILFTGIDGSTYSDRIGHLNGSIAADVESATHLVSDKIRRTERFLAGYSITPHLMNLKWLDDSLAQGKWLLELTEYQLQDQESEKQFGFEIKSRQVNADCLQGWSVYCTPQVIPTRGVMEQIVKAAGGTLLKTAPTEFDQSVLIVSCPPDVQAGVSAPLLSLGFTIYDKEMVLTTVLRQRVELKQHILVAAEDTATKVAQQSAKKGKGRARR